VRRATAGQPADHLKAVGEQWWARYRRPDTLVAATVEALAAHRAAGDTVVLISGSLRACIDPIGHDLGANLVICSDPTVNDIGRLTGEVLEPMVGPRKAETVNGACKRRGIDPTDCIAYADHSSDLDMLRAVGRPVVVGTHPVLVQEATLHGWPVLSGRPAAARSARPVVSVA
jgi:HAD superfamily hydrolase (TIGR01490 family)